MALSPMMRQYLEIKEENKDNLLFFRLGDFYELFFEDAKTASRELDLTLTGKDCGLEERAPMCGVPFHAADTYVKRLIEKGYKVAICEQLEDPATAKGLVKRGIVRIVTPGTISEMNMLDDTKNNFILSIYERDERISLSYCDVSTGAFYAEEGTLANLNNLLIRINPTEIIYSSENSKLDNYLKSSSLSFYCSPYDNYAFQSSYALKTLLNHFKVISMLSFGIDDDSIIINSAGALLQYLLDTQKNSLDHIKKVKISANNEFMVLDAFTVRNLELLENIRDKSKKSSLLGLLDKTRTAMGARKIRNYIEKPLLSKVLINQRLNAVSAIVENIYLRSELRTALNEIYDIERLLSRISYGSLDARDVVMIRNSIAPIPYIKELLKDVKDPYLQELGESLDPLNDIKDLMDKSITDDPPVGIKEGDIIKAGYNSEVDRLRELKNNANKWLRDLEQREREETGIKTLRVGFNKVFGYYIEVTNSFLGQVPSRYIRKQTLTGGERYITEELKKLEDDILNASEQCNRLEYQLFSSIREELSQYIDILQNNADIIATVDTIQSFAQVSYDNNYVKPKINTNGTIDIKGGRHPVVESFSKIDFIPNDTYMDTKDDRLLLITGPNMAGKSTFMRQTGLIVLMAQIGCFVPAQSANISIVDRIFTRVGASDDLSSGQSTFMMEMNELASILNNATKDSLIILDEIGRGTSTLDGLSIAWATIEYLQGEHGIGSKTLFATHYHELISLEGMIPGLRNYSVGVKEINKEIIFLHKIVKGGTDKSFGIEVAKLAGLPKGLLNKANMLLKQLERQNRTDITEIDTENIPEDNNDNENEREVIRSLKGIDINSLTPFEALSILNDLKEKLK